MLKKRRLPTLLALVCGLAAGIDAAALGFGRAPQTAVLGQPLDFAVPLRLEAGESLAAECLNAEVMVGENRVPPYLVRAQLEGDGSAVRVITTPAIDEPVVAVTITAGCASRISRRFLLLADPPLSAPVFSAPPPPIMLADAGNAAPQLVAVNNRVDPGPAGLPTAAANEAPAAAPRGPTPSPRAPNPTPRATAKAEPARQPGRPSNAAARPARKPAAEPAAEPVARLKLDAVEPVADPAAPPAAAVIEEAIAVVAEAASAARASALAASAAAQRIGALEQDVAALRAQASASADEAARWRAQAQSASTEQRWFRPLWGAVLLLATLCAWLAWRMRVLRQADQRSWLLAAEAAAKAQAAPAAPARAVTAPIPLVNSELDLPPAAPRQAWPAPVPVPALDTPAPLASGAVPAVLSPAALPTPAAPARPTPADLAIEPAAEPANQRTDVLAPNLRFDDGAARDVSIEELLDLEQQAEFFIALGQDDAAVDLLVEHLRSTGGGSPLPYLKLLEIYRRRGDPQAYERTRARFNDRFNAYAPDWDSDLQGGRSIEEYAGIVPRLQQAWPRPLDAMAELEALLFRKSRGELFDLPAYREVLFLYSLARDLLEREPSEADQVDILLPLSEGDTPSAPVPLAAEGAEAANEPISSRPTEPVDLDLSMPTGTESLFGDLPAAGRQRS